MEACKDAFQDPPPPQQQLVVKSPPLPTMSSIHSFNEYANKMIEGYCCKLSMLLS